MHPPADQRHEVQTQTDRAKAARHMVFELLNADQEGATRTTASRHSRLVEAMNLEVSRFPKSDTPKPISSHPAMAVNLDACIHCNLLRPRLPRSAGHDVIGMAWRGRNRRLVFDFDDPMGQSMRRCGECVQACPTGALMPKSIVDDKQRAAAASPSARSTRFVPMRRRLSDHLQPAHRRQGKEYIARVWKAATVLPTRTACA